MKHLRMDVAEWLPAVTRRWIERSVVRHVADKPSPDGAHGLGDGQHFASARIHAVRRLQGGISSVVHQVSVECGSEPVELVVKRPYFEHDDPSDPARAVTHEAETLQALAPHALVPLLVAFDPTGEHAGSPAIVQTLLPGRSFLAIPSLEANPLPSRPNVSSALNIDEWIHGLALATHAVSKMAAPIGGPKLPRFVPWFSFDKLHLPIGRLRPRHGGLR